MVWLHSQIADLATLNLCMVDLLDTGLELNGSNLAETMCYKLGETMALIQYCWLQ